MEAALDPYMFVLATVPWTAAVAHSPQGQLAPAALSDRAGAGVGGSQSGPAVGIAASPGWPPFNFHLRGSSRAVANPRVPRIMFGFVPETRNGPEMLFWVALENCLVVFGGGGFHPSTILFF